MAPRTSESSAHAITLDVTPASSDDPSAPGWAIGFIEGSRPQIAIETAGVLRYRLRAAAGFLLLAFSLFFAYRLVVGDTFGRDSDLTFYLHFAVLVVLASSCVLLCRRCAIPMRVLRGYELAIFGVPSAYLLVYDEALFRAFAPLGFLPSPVAPWMGTVFTYAMFIPNTWRRAAVVHGVLCAAPVLLFGYLYASDPNFAAVVRNNPLVTTEMLILLGVTFLASTYGTYMINLLRVQAFEARQLGQYRLCKLIGAGGMGEVYLAEHQMMKRPCAIKLIRPSRAADPLALARFEREVRAMARLSHWNTVEVFDYGRAEDGTFYYVMEFLPGMSLADLVERHGPLPPGRAIHLLVQTCDGLAEAHCQGLIHRDLKPGNIFAAKRGGIHDVAKVLDFGLAKPIATGNEPIQLTQEGGITGSPLYMSPEQALGDGEPDARSDIYSLGAVAYYLLTGSPPFDGDRAIKVILAHAQQEVVPPSQLRSEIPDDLERVVLRCLAKNPAERYADIGALRAALAACQSDGGWNSTDAAGWWASNGTRQVDCEATAGAL